MPDMASLTMGIHMREGARRVWRHQRILWWLVFINFLLAAFGTIPMASRVGSVADHSLHSQALSARFDLFAFVELASNPDVAFWSKTTDNIWFALIFFVFALFVTGGTLETYRADRKLTNAEFFQACGAYFWRWMRLVVYLLIVLAPIFFLASGITKWSDKLSEDSSSEMMGFWVDVGGLLFVLLVMMVIRLWFDMAQIRAVAEQETAMRRNLARTFKLIFRNFGALFGMYFCISLFAWLGFMLAWWLWLRIPGERIGSSFVLFEVVLVWWIGTRLWQRASETAWYEGHAEVAALAPMYPSFSEAPSPSLPQLPDPAPID
jgi:NADH:ubiquinone oxidoreductase subunit 6 (subunit J)